MSSPHAPGGDLVDRILEDSEISAKGGAVEKPQASKNVIPAQGTFQKLF